MNLFERQLAMYEARVKKIEANPSSTRMSTNKERYQAQADYYRQMLRYWEEGRPFAYVDLADEILECCGIIPIHMERTSDALARYSAGYIDLANSYGFPMDVCTRIRSGVGIAISGELPPPVIAVADAQVCESRAPRFAFVARHFKVPLVVFDAPPDDESEDAVQYVAEQYWDLVHMVEDMTGNEFDEDKLRGMQEGRVRNREFMREMEELQKAVPSPLDGKDALRGPLGGTGADSNECAQQFLAELREKVARKYTPLGEEKLRVAWLVSAPLYADPFTPMQGMGVAFPVYDIGGRTGSVEKMQTEEYWERWRTDSPIVREARARLGNPWRGKAEKRVQNTVNICRDYRIDAVVHFNQWGCRQNNLSAKLVAERLEEELGIPTLIIEGDCTDVRNYNEAEFLSQLEEFFTVCIMMKEAH